MKSFAMFSDGPPPGWSSGPGLGLQTVGAGRRRLLVFSCVFLLVAVTGLAFTFVRPAQYRAIARLQINPPTALGATLLPVPGTSGMGASAMAVAPAPAPEAGESLQGQIQILTSRPLLEQAWERLLRAGQAPADLGDNPVDILQARLGAAAIEGTRVVQLWADGRDAASLPGVVNTLIQVYTEHLAETYQSNSADTLQQTRDEAAKLEQDVTAKRGQVRDFQLRYGIVSQERDEHAVLARAKAMSTAVSAANEKLVKAEAQLRSLQEAAAAGRSAVRAKDNPTLASMEQRASQLREELRDLERNYAPAYMEMDPQARAKRVRLAELEEQIRAERGASQTAAIAEAQEEVASARSAASQMQQQIAGDRREVQDFSLHFNEYKAMQAQLADLETLQRGAQERLARLEASENGRRPTVEVIQWADVPSEAFSPRYGRDAAISLGAALALALFAVWLVDYLRPRPAQPALAPAWMPIPVALQRAPLPGVLPLADMERLPAPHALPRELAHTEVAALLAAAGGTGRRAVSALLAGLSGEEALALRWEDVDFAEGVVRIAGAVPRSLPLAGALRTALEEGAGPGAPTPVGPVLEDGQGRALVATQLDGLLLSAAHDAGLDAPAEVSAAALRHTYLAYLVRQGVRFTDLPAIVGPLPVAALAAYSPLAPAGPRIPAERVDWVYRCEAA